MLQCLNLDVSMPLLLFIEKAHINIWRVMEEEGEREGHILKKSCCAFCLASNWAICFTLPELVHIHTGRDTYFNFVCFCLCVHWFRPSSATVCIRGQLVDIEPYLCILTETRPLHSCGRCRISFCRFLCVCCPSAQSGVLDKKTVLPPSSCTQALRIQTQVTGLV